MRKNVMFIVQDALGGDIRPAGLYAYSNRDSSGCVTITVGKLTNTSGGGRVTLTVVRRSSAHRGRTPETVDGPHKKTSVFANTLIPVMERYLTNKEKRIFKSIPDNINMDIAMWQYVSVD